MIRASWIGTALTGRLFSSAVGVSRGGGRVLQGDAHGVAVQRGRPVVSLRTTGPRATRYGTSTERPEHGEHYWSSSPHWRWWSASPHLAGAKLTRLCALIRTGSEVGQRRSAISLSQLLLVIFCYLLLEWLFFATKASFLSLLPFGEQVQILFATYFLFLAYGLPVQLALLLIDSVIRRQAPRLRKLPLLAIGPALCATALVLMQFDSFTHTVLGFGIVRTSGFQPYLYLAAVTALFLLLLYYMSREQAGLTENRFRLRVAIAITLISISVVLTVLRGSTPVRRRGVAEGLVTSELGGKRLPNIVLLAADGVDADHLAAYGYGRETTPFLDQLLDDALIVDNAIANSAKTSGSLTSMLTGKLPTTTKVIYGPHVLSAADAFQHLPGILKHLGYRTLQESIREWGDSTDLNMKRAFDVGNGRTVRSSRFLSLPANISERFAWEMVFYDKLLDRISPRVRHILGIERMEDTFGMVKPFTREVVWGTSDETRVARSLDFMKENAGPFFVHLHLIGTHCCDFRPERRQFSAGASKDSIETDEDYLDTETRDNFYDDTILDTDWHLGKIFAWLEESGEIENTVIVYSSDHTEGWDVNRRVPLIFRFPHGEHRGRLRQTAQLLDVAPTLLDYIGVGIPPWMEGASLLRPGELSDLRPLFATSKLQKVDFTDEQWRSNLDWGPPFYGLKAMAVVLCHRWYKFNLHTGEGIKGEIPNHSRRCPDSAFPTDLEIRSVVASHLQERRIG